MQTTATVGRFDHQEEDEKIVLLLDHQSMMHLLNASGFSLSIVFLFSLGFLWNSASIGQVTVWIVAVLIIVSLVMYVAAFFLIRNRSTVLGRRILFYAMIICSTIGVILFGGPLGPLAFMFLVPVISAGLLGNGRDSFFVAAATLVIYMVLFITQTRNLYTPLHLSPAVNAVIFSLTGCFIAYMSGMSGRDLAMVVAQSQQRAQQLIEKTDQLMQKNIQQIELGSELAAAAGELQVASQSQASGATDQASAVSEVSTTIEQLGSTARQIAQLADHVSQAAQQTLENLSSGQDAVDESIQAMERIRGRVSDVSNRVLSLGERSQQIGEIIDLIDDISDETHLLALNAAIEAAGAGEHGRRFAVVAAEVKSLANRTLAAAREVKGVIAEIRQATSASVLASEEGSKEVERGVELAHRAGQTMDNIVMVAERTVQSAAEIGLATAQQQSASEQVVETMREIAEVARQTALGSRQMAEAAVTLTSIADRLHGIVANEK
ncbi:methyl-accepting chemotaxis protein [Candidatus Chloroploca sp. Khr17]|uniref:methyl-accepting chemotaxis protein n=1 Tax=Candidatus Chloroploca sp. Khr17 TaxID=2496869 RepID=UPI00101C1221|nr:methyl-accepting chemotaxis protein [Candidatus Chloroploca sp. Khr17]